MRGKLLIGSIAQIAKAAGVSESTVRRRIKSGAVQAIRLDHRCIRCVQLIKPTSCTPCALRS